MGQVRWGVQNAVEVARRYVMSVKARGISSVLIVLGAGNANACVALEVVSKIVLFVPAWEYFIKLGPGLIARNAMGQV